MSEPQGKRPAASTGSRWRRAQELWTAARDVPESERSAWLDARCRDDPQLRREVADLLAADGEVGDRFERLVNEAVVALEDGAPPIAVPGPNDADLDGLLTHRQFGYVSVQERLGEGGMGRVYRGIDQRLGRQVALKVLRPELASQPRMVSRLAREARLLSKLEHPCICKIYDLIQLPRATGLVLELIRGQSLRRAMGSGVERRQALKWTEGLAEALATAHGVGVVHRDLKPDNIMVTDLDELKILDFGIARDGEDELSRVESDSASRVLDRTATGELLGTYLYMSPEQAQGEVLTPATDVFSLGLLLFELLSGQPAYSPQEQGDRWFEAVLQGQVPPLVDGDPALVRLLARMTDADPSARPAAWEVAESLSAIRQARRLRRRRRFRLAGMVAVSLLSVVMTWQALRAGREAERARQEAETSHQMSRLLTDLLQASSPWSPVPVGEVRGDLSTLRKTLRESVTDLQAEWVHNPESQIRFLDDAADLALTLEMLPEARDASQRALQLRRSLYPDDHPELAMGLALRGDILYSEGRWDEGLELARQAVAILDRQPQVPIEHYLEALSALEVNAGAVGELEEAATASRRLIAMSLPRWGEDSEEVVESRRALGFHYYYMAIRDGDADRLAQAREIFETNLAIDQQVRSEDSAWFALTLCDVARIDVEDGNLSRAEERFRRAINILHGEVGDGSRRTATVQSLLAIALHRQGRFEEADALLREAVDVMEQYLGPQHRALAKPLAEWSEVRLALDDPVAAERLVRRALDLVDGVLSPGHWELRIWQAHLSSALAAQGKTDEAQTVPRGIRGDGSLP